MRIESCVNTILDLNKLLGTGKIKPEVVQQFERLKESLRYVREDEVDEEDIDRIEQATNALLAEIRVAYGENPIGNQDKMTSIDILRMGEALGCKVVIPFHYDIWTNFKADPLEILMLYNYKKNVLDYQFKPFIWDVGGKYTWPQDKDKIQYHYRRGFEDCFTDEPNVPFRSIL